MAVASLLFAVHGLRSALNNTTALARLLVDRGHDVTFASFRDVRAEVEHVGARFVFLSDGPEARAELAKAQAARGKIGSLATARRLRHDLLELAQPQRVLHEVNPDLAIVDIEMHGMVLAVHRLDVPSVHTLSWHDPTRAWSRPPMHTELAPGNATAYPLRVAWAWAALIARRRVRQLAGPLTKPGAVARVLPPQLNTPDRATIQAMARRLDVDLDTIASRHDWINPHTYVHRPIMSYTIRELEFDQASPVGVTHVGPIIDPKRHERLNAPNHDLAAFLDRFSTAGRRLVYCSMGSLQQANARFYQMVIDAFADEPDWGVVIGLGSRGAGVDLRIPNDRVLVLDNAPQLDILQRCAVAIHTGGASTFYECLRYAVPSVVLHTGRTDMPGIAARVTHFGLGVVRDRHQITAEELARHAHRLGRGECAQELDRIRNVIVGYEDRSEAVQLIERLARG